jgi:O-succinylbenzoic acid--CoA ligase
MGELSVFAAAHEEPLRDCLIADGHAWTFAEVAGRVASAIAALRELGVTSGQRVALAPDVGVDSAVWVYALFELGCPAVLLHPHLTERERTAVLSDAEAVHVISEQAPAAREGQPAVDPVADDRTLAIVYTSGTRGTPRGARLSRRAFVASEAAHASNLGWRPTDRWLLGMPPAHVGGLSILTRCLIARRCVVLAPGPFDPVETIRIMERDRVTLLSVVPTMLHRLLACDPPWKPTSELRAVLVGGAAFPDALRQQASERGIPALGTYGCTEACSQVATQTLAQAGQPGCGAPLRGIEVRIGAGEIQVRGETIMDGYVGEDRPTGPWTADGWLRTGDLGSFASDGQLLVDGRLDDLIVTGGENVAPREVEAWLETVPGIVSACVFAVPDEEWGQQVVAAIVTDASAHDFDVLRARMNEELAAHKRPKQLAVLDALPLNRSGKVDREAVTTSRHWRASIPIADPRRPVATWAASAAGRW